MSASLDRAIAEVQADLEAALAQYGNPLPGFEDQELALWIRQLRVRLAELEDEAHLEALGQAVFAMYADGGG